MLAETRASLALKISLSPVYLGREDGKRDRVPILIERFGGMGQIGRVIGGGDLNADCFGGGRFLD